MALVSLGSETLAEVADILSDTMDVENVYLSNFVYQGGDVSSLLMRVSRADISRTALPLSHEAMM